MKKLLLLPIAVFFSFPAISQSNADLGVGAMGLVVSDIEASTAFYRDIIGMVEAGGFDLDEQWSKEAGAANNRPFKVKMFKMVDAPTATVVKLAYFDKTDKRQALSGIDNQSGVNYITLYYNYEGFANFIKRVEAAGIEKVGWVKRDRYQLVFIRDPDGVFVELVGPPDQ